MYTEEEISKINEKIENKKDNFRKNYKDILFRVRDRIGHGENVYEDDKRIFKSNGVKFIFHRRDFAMVTSQLKIKYKFRTVFEATLLSESLGNPSKLRIKEYKSGEWEKEIYNLDDILDKKELEQMNANLNSKLEKIPLDSGGCKEKLEDDELIKRFNKILIELNEIRYEIEN